MTFRTLKTFWVAHLFRWHRFLVSQATKPLLLFLKQTDTISYDESASICSTNSTKYPVQLPPTKIHTATPEWLHYHRHVSSRALRHSIWAHAIIWKKEKRKISSFFTRRNSLQKAAARWTLSTPIQVNAGRIIPFYKMYLDSWAGPGAVILSHTQAEYNKCNPGTCVTQWLTQCWGW